MSERNSGWVYRPALDGVRALAVTAVILYHLGYGWAKGGFLGVDTFFVLSGYLITSLLLIEFRNERTIRLLAFWGRRARRLLPAVLLLLGVTAIAGALWTSKLELNRLRGDGLSGLFYVANWRFIASGQSYFDLFSAPSPLRHLWSLAIEEQFYLLWPIVLLVTMRLARGASRALAGVCIAGIAASAIAMAALYNATDPSRSYYGTDTRMQTILVGALLAIALEHRRLNTRTTRTSVWVGTAALVGIVACFVLVSEHSWFLYHGGSLLFACLVVPVVIMSVGAGQGPALNLLTLTPVRWVGRVSYGLYLWHWPMIVWLTPARAHINGIPLDTVRVVAAVGAAAISYYLIERPIRHASFATLPRRFAALATAAITAIAILGATANAQAQPSYYAVAANGGPRVCPPLSSEMIAARMVAEAPNQRRTPPARHRLLLVGDSTACSLYPGLSAVGALNGVLVTQATVVACGVVSDEVSGQAEPMSRQCHETVRRVEEQAFNAARPDLIVWTSTWERIDIMVNGRVLRVGTQEWKRELSRRFDRAIERFTAGGARLVILTQPRFVTKEPSDPTFANLNKVIVEAGRRHPGVEIIDLSSRVCPTDGACPSMVDGLQPRKDGAHYTAEGGVWVSRWLLPRVVDR